MKKTGARKINRQLKVKPVDRPGKEELPPIARGDSVLVQWASGSQQRDKAKKKRGRNWHGINKPVPQGRKF